jgi:transposase
MGFLFDKQKKGRLYTYWGESARVKGKPRLIEQIYLGPKDRVLEEIKSAYTRGQAPGPTPLRQLDHLEFGASAWLWSWVGRLGLIELVDRHVPAVEKRRRTQLTVGQYLALAAVNRAVAATSKRSFYVDWYRSSVISRLCPAREGELTSQRFWDHMDPVKLSHIDAVQQDLMARLKELFPLGEETLLYDTTNYFTFIDSANERSQLAQRGHNKQKRSDLRQLSLALFEDEETGLPLYHQCYTGQRPDVSQFTTAWQSLLERWLKGVGTQPEQLTLVFDKGNPSRRNLAELDASSLHHVGSLPGRWVADLLEIPQQRYEKLELAATKHVTAYRCRRFLWGKQRTLLVVFSPSLYRKQVASLNRLQLKVQQCLLALAETVAGGRTRVGTVEKKIAEWTSRDHLRKFLQVHIKSRQERALEVKWSWNQTEKRAIQRRYYGKTVLFTDRDDWSSPQIVQAYRRLSRTEQLFRLSKGRSGPWWPMYHWTDSKIRVHALYCHFALLLLAILQFQLRQAGLTCRADRCLKRLARIQQTRVLYTNGAAERVLSHLDEEQETLDEALGVTALARQMGTTLLK